MSSVTFVLLSLGVAIFSLMLVSIANRRQTRSRLISRRLMQLKRRVHELEELSVSIEPLLESSAIPRIINEEIVDKINMMSELEPDSQLLDVSLASANDRRELLMNPANKAELYRVQESDAALARAQYILNEAGVILRRRQASGHMEVSELESYIRDLAWAYMMVSVVTHVAQGHKTFKRGDVLRAFAFYKKAQQVAMETSNSDERRHTLIRELGDILANKRKALSHDLMPETQFNPDENAPSLDQPATEV